MIVSDSRFERFERLRSKDIQQAGCVKVSDMRRKMVEISRAVCTPLETIK